MAAKIGYKMFRIEINKKKWKWRMVNIPLGLDKHKRAAVSGKNKKKSLPHPPPGFSWMYLAFHLHAVLTFLNEFFEVLGQKSVDFFIDIRKGGSV